MAFNKANRGKSLGENYQIINDNFGQIPQPSAGNVGKVISFTSTEYEVVNPRVYQTVNSEDDVFSVLFRGYKGTDKNSTTSSVYFNPLIYANPSQGSLYANKFITTGSSSDYVVLGDGSTKPLSEIGGGTSEKEIVAVDVQTLIANQDVETFVDLTKRAANGEIVLLAKLDTIMGIVTGVDVSSDTNMAWTLAAAHTTFSHTPGMTFIDEAQLDVGAISYNGTSLSLGLTAFPLPKSTNTKTPYATSSTASATLAKVATISSNDDNFALEVGQRVIVKFTSANTVANPTLNVDSTGAKPIRDKDGNALTAATSWNATEYCEFQYDGTNWVWLNSRDTKATVSKFGPVRPKGTRASAISATTGGTTSGRYYGVELDGNGTMFVNVPWVAGSSSGSGKLYMHNITFEANIGGLEVYVMFTTYETNNTVMIEQEFLNKYSGVPLQALPGGIPTNMTFIGTVFIRSVTSGYAYGNAFTPAIYPIDGLTVTWGIIQDYVITEV